MIWNRTRGGTYQAAFSVLPPSLEIVICLVVQLCDGEVGDVVVDQDKARLKFVRSRA